MWVIASWAPVAGHWSIEAGAEFAEPLLEGQYYLNTDAFEVTNVSTRKKIVRYTAATEERQGMDEREIIVRTSDGFTFPVDVRLSSKSSRKMRRCWSAMFGDDEEGMRGVMTSAVRAIFRNNAENVKALDYVKQRSMQESQSLEMLQNELAQNRHHDYRRADWRRGRRKIARHVAENTNRPGNRVAGATHLSRTAASRRRKEAAHPHRAGSEEEKRLATASYEVQIAEQEQKKRVIAAEAEAQAIKIRRRLSPTHTN